MNRWFKTMVLAGTVMSMTLTGCGAINSFNNAVYSLISPKSDKATESEPGTIIEEGENLEKTKTVLDMNLLADLKDSISKQDFKVISEEVSLKGGTSDGTVLLKSIVANKSKLEVSNITLAYVAWGKTGEGIALEPSKNYSDGAYIQQVDFHDVDIVTSDSSGKEFEFKIENKAGAAVFESIVVSVETNDGYVRTNPLYGDWTECVVGKSYMIDSAQEAESESGTESVCETLETPRPGSVYLMADVEYVENGSYTIISEKTDDGLPVLKTWYDKNGKILYKLRTDHDYVAYSYVSRRIDPDGRENGYYQVNCDSSWRRLNSTHYNADGLKDNTVVFSYNPSGNLEKQTRYNADGTLDMIIYCDEDSNRTRVEYYGSNEKLKKVIRGTYENGNRIEEVVEDESGKLISRYTSSYDSEHNRTNIVWYGKDNKKEYEINYMPNLQNCTKALLTVYDKSGKVEKEEVVSDLSEIKLP